MRIVFLIGFGLFPLWAAAALFGYFYWGLHADNAGMTLWAMVLAIPACAVTLTIAIAALIIHLRTEGYAWRKFRFAAGFVAAACLVIVAAGFWFAMNSQKQEQMLELEKARVVQFVKDNPKVQQAADGIPTVSISTYAFANPPLPPWYVVSAVGGKEVYAIVDVNRRTTTASFQLRCVASGYWADRDIRKGQCEQ